jgi:flagellar biosynthesis protein FliP
MSNRESQLPDSENSSEDEPSSGPNLTLIYAFITLALAAAIAFALMIVIPFYQRR